jgi:hypothetical protein
MTTASAPSSAPAPPANNRYQLLERIITAVVGAVILALQGINIGETSSNAELIRRVEETIRQQAEEGTRIDKALENQAKMIDRLDRTLDILDKEQTKQ